MVTALLWPALWNGFPLVFHDTGGYLARPFEGTLELGRSAFYGAFLAAGIAFDFWPNIVVQAAIVVWLVVLTLRLHELPGPAPAAATILTLAVLTGLPWYTAQLMPDVFVPAAVLCLYLLAFRYSALRRWEIIALSAVVIAAVASHAVIAVLSVALIVILLAMRPLAARLGLVRPRLRAAVTAVTTAMLFAPLSNLALTGNFALTPGGVTFVFTRLFDEGIVARYLADKCPDPSLKLCAYRDRLPPDGDRWLWGDGPLRHGLGGWQQFEPEARRIILESVVVYPRLHLERALASSLRQFVLLRTGDGLADHMDYTQSVIKERAPNAFPAYERGRQQRRVLTFATINAIHVPVALFAIGLLPLLMALRLSSAVRPAALTLALFILFTLIANAAICGSLSIPSDRYQSRLAWLAPLAAIIVAAAWRRRHMPEGAR
jgi:hypothetical protein